MIRAEDFAEEYIPTKVKVSYGLGNAGNLALSNLVFGSITYFYNTKMGLDGTLLGIGWLIFGIWNALNDPLFGWLTDNTRSTLGRRVPYLRYGSIFYGLVFVLCWYPTFKPDNQTALFANFMIIMIAFDTMFTMLATVYFCLPSEMAESAEQRASVAWYGTVFSMVAIAIQFVVPALLLTGERGTNINTYFRPAMIIIAIICSLLIFFSSYQIRENEFTQIQDQEGFLAGLKKTFKNKHFLQFEAANFSVTMLTWILMTGIFYYIDYVVVFDLATLYTPWWRLVLIIVSIAIIARIILYELDNIQAQGPRNFLIFALAVLTVGFLILYFAGSSFQEAIWGFLLVGMGYIMANITVAPLMGDVMDYDELQLGTRREGAYAGINAIITKPAISIANWAFLGIIDAFGFFRPFTLEDGTSIKYPQTDSAINGILFSLFLVPAFFALIAIVAMAKYKLHGKAWRKEKESLELIHAQKERDYFQHCLTEEEMKNFDPDLFSDLGETEDV